MKENRRFNKVFNRHEDKIVSNVSLIIGNSITQGQIDKIQKLVRENLADLRKELEIDVVV